MCKSYIKQYSVKDLSRSEKSSYIQVYIYFRSQKLWHFHKNIRSCVENECCCPRTVNCSNDNFTSKTSSHHHYMLNRLHPPHLGPTADDLTSWHENALRVTGPLWGESTLTKWPIMCFDVFILAWTSSCTNNDIAGELRHHFAVYVVIIVSVYRKHFPVKAPIWYMLCW